jgi:hypothetical protein
MYHIQDGLLCEEILKARPPRQEDKIQVASRSGHQPR